MRRLEDYLRAHPRLDSLALAAALTIFLGLALHNISRWSIWFDEAFGVYLSKLNVLEIAHYTARDQHPPLYYIVLKAWEALFSTSELAVRSLSVVFAMVAIGFGFLIIRRLFGRLPAVLSLPIMTLAPMTLRYAQEARMYTMAMAICAAATYVLIVLYPRPPRDARTRKRLWLVYALLVAAGLWTHYFTSLVWIVHWVWRYITLRQSHQKRQLKQLFSSEWLKVYLLAAVLFLPWIPFLTSQFFGLQKVGFWIGNVTLDNIIGVFSTALVYQPAWRLQQWSAVLFITVGLLLIVLGTRLYRQLPLDKKSGYILLCLYAFLPIVVLAVLSLPPLRPIMTERYFTHTLLGLYMLIGVILSLYKWPRHTVLWRSLSFGVVLIMLGFGVSNVYMIGNFNNSTLTQPSAKQAMQLVATHSTGHEPVIIDNSLVFYEVVYYQTLQHPVYIIDTPHNFKNSATWMIRDHEPHKIESINSFARIHPRIWVISKYRGAFSPSMAGWEKVECLRVNVENGYYVTLFATS